MPRARLELARHTTLPPQDSVATITPPGHVLVRDERFELPTSVESGQSSTTELTAHGAPPLIRTERTSPFERDDFTNLSSRAVCGANGWTRTNHTQIFSLLLYLMSYVGVKLGLRFVAKTQYQHQVQSQCGCSIPTPCR